MCIPLWTLLILKTNLPKAKKDFLVLGLVLAYLQNLAYSESIILVEKQKIQNLNIEYYSSKKNLGLSKATNFLLNKVKTKKIFKWLKQNNIDDKEMLKTFNCGVGFCLIIDPRNLNKITKFFTKEFKPYVIGKITTGKNKVKLNGKIDWS